MQTNLVDGEPPIFRLRKEWQGLPQEELAEYKRIIFDYYRRTGYVSLKYGGTCIINIANVKTYPDLEKHTVQIGKDVGFVYMMEC